MEDQNSVSVKCNVRAAKVRAEGNNLYRKKDEKDLPLVLAKYNESICWAKSDSEDLAIGYANRSAYWYECEEYECSLANIALAKKHNYPERLMPKLLARELNCKRKIDENECENVVDNMKLVLNVMVNPKIPFVAEGIAMKELPRFGRSMVAEREFKVGNVILSEMPYMTCIGTEAKYQNCQYCTSHNRMSIPCPHCVSVMYCNEECMTKDWKVSHRFECGIYETISSCHMPAKLFFYGLTLFNDDVEEMMKYCKSHTRTGCNPFDLDYTKNDPLGPFKMFHTAKMPPCKPSQEKFHRDVAASLVSIYIQQPLIKSLFASEAQKRFMLEYIFDYSKAIKRLVVAWECSNQIVLHTVASVCNHSCHPNVHAMCPEGRLKFVVIRPIASGDQICISYGPVWGEVSDSDALLQLTLLEIDCACEMCDPNCRERLTKSKVPPQNFSSNLALMRKVLATDTATEPDKLNALQQFIQRYAYLHPLEDIVQVLCEYRMVLPMVFANELYVAKRKACLDAF